MTSTVSPDGHRLHSVKQKQGTNFENEYLSSRHGFIIIISIIEDSRNVDQRSEEEDGTCQDRQTDRKKERMSSFVSCKGFNDGWLVTVTLTVTVAEPA